MLREVPTSAEGMGELAPTMSQQNDTPSEYAPNVRAQYEEYPFPLRDPRDESRRLVVAEQESLGKLNHFCFGGRQDFGGGFRVLVASGGTGDHTIFLAEQLRGYDARVTYVDISRASIGNRQGAGPHSQPGQYRLAPPLDTGSFIDGRGSVRPHQ